MTIGALPPWLSFFTLPSINVRLVLSGCIILGLCSGVLGCFTFLRKRALLGDALSHAALPGVCMAFLLTGTKDPLIILAGAAVSCWLGAISVDLITRYTRCKEDSALGMVLSVYFAVGIMLLTSIQHSGNAAQSGLDKFLLGKAPSMLDRDVWTLTILSVIILGAVAVAYKEFKIISFDPGFAQTLGLPVRVLEVVLATLIVLAVVVGIQAVGVVLMSAMLVTPAAAARFWTDRLSIMAVLAGVFGALSGAAGAYISYLGPGMPTGPWMVIAVTSLFAFSLLFAPLRGFVPRFNRTRRTRRRTAQENILRTLYVLGERENRLDASCSETELLKYRPMRASALLSTLSQLEKKGLVAEDSAGCYALTSDGIETGARLTRLHRLWELYLATKLELAADHVHDDAEEIEHIITPELEARLTAALANPGEDPHARRIPGGHPAAQAGEQT
ncbi:MAG: metal ABC transporter permease [Candidatus Hydrogenedentes bacterium]|nr:metal ABC transporter permease [Candidatus Hydrogenedentota bacterium]